MLQNRIFDSMMPNKYSRFLPFERYSIQTTLSKEEVIERIQVITRTNKAIRFSVRAAVILRAKYDYLGEIYGNTFEIWRNIYYRNSFRPIIYGMISHRLDKTEIRISMLIPLVIRVFLIIIFSMTLIGSIISLQFFPLNFKTFIPIIAVIIGYMVVLFGFRFEARKSKRDLNTILKVEANQSV